MKTRNSNLSPFSLAESLRVLLFSYAPLLRDMPPIVVYAADGSQPRSTEVSMQLYLQRSNAPNFTTLRLYETTNFLLLRSDVPDLTKIGELSGKM